MDEVTVDRQTLKALGADTRINILKNLARKRMTQTELGEVLGIAAPSVNEHLAQLKSAGLVAQIDEGRKWKYYEITQKGRGIVEPSKVKVWFLLGISLIALVASLLQIYPSISMPVQTRIEVTIPPEQRQTQDAASASQPAELVVASSPQTTLVQGASELPSEVQTVEVFSKPLLSSLPLAETLIFLASLVFIGISLALLLKRE